MEKLADLDADALLAFAESTLRRRRQLEVDDLAAGAHWAVLHGLDPTVEDSSGVRRPGGPKLVQVGGEGTPRVQDLCLAELAISRQTHALATRWMVADALDLIHRLPRCWVVVTALECEVWVARKLARATRHLSASEAAHVDAAVATALAGEQPGRFFTILEAKIIEANPELHAERISAERARRYVSLGRVDEAGLRHVIARVEHGDAVWVDALINRIADILATRDAVPGEPGKDRDMLRSLAFGWLARPAELLALLLENADQDDTPPAPRPDDVHADPDVTSSADTTDSTHGTGHRDSPVGTHSSGSSEGTHGSDTEHGGESSGVSERDREEPQREEQFPDWIRGFPRRLLDTLKRIDPSKLRPTAVVYVHLHQAALDTGTGVARVEDGGGPRLVQHLSGLLGTAHVTLKPVIDLNDRISINAYEHPGWLRERIHLITPAEPFPYSTRVSRKGDIDHPVPFRFGRDGPPAPTGQTGDLNAAPLGRYSHRVKTHAQYTVRQPGPGIYLWRTPNGRHYLVDHNGTHAVDEWSARDLTSPSVIEQRLALLLFDHGVAA